MFVINFLSYKSIKNPLGSAENVLCNVVLPRYKDMTIHDMMLLNDPAVYKVVRL